MSSLRRIERACESRCIDAARVVLLVGALLTGCSQEDPRRRAVDEVLSPPWREGMSWSLEVHGGLRRDKLTKSFWGISHFVVEAIDGDRATVSGSFHPVVFPSYEDAACNSRLEFERRPWRLARVEVQEKGSARVISHEVPAAAFAIWPCVPPVPRHPHARAGASPETRRPQKVSLDGHDVVFTVKVERPDSIAPWDRITTVTRWRAGSPWWSRNETADGEGRSVYGHHASDQFRHQGRQDNLFVERARLVAIDGQPIRAARWSIPSPKSTFHGSRNANAPRGLPPEGLVFTESP